VLLCSPISLRHDYSEYHACHCNVDNVVVDAIKLIVLNYSNFSIAKIVVKKIERVK